jgi:hypothetical protein
MTFDDWFYGTQGYGLRCEWFGADLVAYADPRKTAGMALMCDRRIVDWLKSAYQVGYEHAMGNLLDDGK